jgi:hypothetical protein
LLFCSYVSCQCWLHKEQEPKLTQVHSLPLSSSTASAYCYSAEFCILISINYYRSVLLVGLSTAWVDVIITEFCCRSLILVYPNITEICRHGIDVDKNIDINSFWQTLFSYAKNSCTWIYMYCSNRFYGLN